MVQKLLIIKKSLTKKSHTYISLKSIKTISMNKLLQQKHLILHATKYQTIWVGLSFAR